MMNKDILVDDDEVYSDIRSPIGKLIQQLNSLSKKPKIDVELNTALDIFSQKISQQEQLLRNGIVKINFAEAGLFFQSCSVLFGKTVDILWDQALELHTRLIKYDYENDRAKGKKLDKHVIEKLEESKNKYKRKNMFKLIVTDRKDKNILLFDNSIGNLNIGGSDNAPSQTNILYTAWYQVKHCYEDIAKIPKAVFAQQRKMYKLDNYDIVDGADADIFDIDDGEFNTKYSRMPTWHHIEHLFEYNREGLLPDKNNLIARLWLAIYGEICFLRDQKIPLNAPFRDYEKQYIGFKKQFFENEAQKWQNMPLDTMADLRRQMEYLAEHGSGKAINSCFEQVNCGHNESDGRLNSILNQDIPHNGSSESPNTKLNQDISAHNGVDDSSLNQDIHTTIDIEVQMGSDATFNQAAIETTFANNSNSTTDDTLKTNIEKLPAAVVNRKCRPDSGFCDVRSETRSVFDPIDSIAQPNNSLMESGFLTSASMNSSADMNNEVQSMLDHVHVENQEYQSKKGHNDQVANNQSLNTTITEEMAPLKLGHTHTAMVQKSKEANVSEKETGPPNKRRKLSKKQLEKLLNSLVPPVGEPTFEKFFSMNYQPELGEGEIRQVENESCALDADQSSEIRIADCESVPISLPIQDNKSESMSEKNPLCHPEESDVIISNQQFLSNNIEHSVQLHDVRGNGDTVNITSAASEQDTRPVGEENLLRINNHEQNRIDNSFPNIIQQSLICEDELYQQLLAALKEGRNGNSISEAIVKEKHKHMADEKKASRERLEDWRKMITPILSNLKENDFDIHQYGSKIMENLQVNEIKFFKHIVCGKSPVDVVRFFISSLQLANTGNIEICEINEGNLSNDTFGLKLLRTDRYHDHLTDYYAPSEKTFRDCVEKIRRNQSKNEQSQNDFEGKRMKNESKHKKAKLIETSSSTQIPEIILQQQNANQKEKRPVSGITLSWVGYSNMKNSQPMTSYADHPNDSGDSSLMQVICPPNEELSPSLPTEIIFINDLEHGQRSNLGYPLFSTPHHWSTVQSIYRKDK